MAQLYTTLGHKFPKDFKSTYHRDTYMFVATLVTIAKLKNLSMCLSVAKLIKMYE